MRPKILIVCGSSRAEPNLLGSARVVERAAVEAGAEVRVLGLNDLGLPIMVVGDEDQAALASVQTVRETAAWADGYVLGTPEYHGNMSGALKNWFDFLWEELAGKVAGLIATTGAGTGDMSMTAVRNSLVWCHGIPLPFSAAATEDDFVDGELQNDRVRDRLERIGHDVVRYTRALRPAYLQAQTDAGVAAGFAGLHARH
jgi:FMN reductase